MVHVWGRREVHNFIGKHEGKKKIGLYSDGNRPNTDLKKKSFNIVNWILLAPDRNTKVSSYRKGHMSLEFTEGGVYFLYCERLLTAEKTLHKVEILS